MSCIAVALGYIQLLSDISGTRSGRRSTGLKHGKVSFLIHWLLRLTEKWRNGEDLQHSSVKAKGGAVLLEIRSTGEAVCRSDHRKLLMDNKFGAYWNLEMQLFDRNRNRICGSALT